MNKIKYSPIGIIHTPNKEPEGTPIQPRGAEGIEGEIQIFSKYTDGLKDLEGFSHIILLYHFHKSGEAELQIKPYMDKEKHGVFAMRGPGRPNPIGLSIVKLNDIKDNRLYIENVDIVDGTPLLDIKPYVPDFDIHDVESFGWLEENVQKLDKTTDDGRFVDED